MRCAGVPEHAQNTKGRYYANPRFSASSGVSRPPAPPVRAAAGLRRPAA